MTVSSTFLPNHVAAPWRTLVLILGLALSSLVAFGQTVSSFSPTTGNTGTTVNINGSGFVNVTAVNFNGVSAAFFVSSSTSIISQVPAGATTGRISVVTSSGTATSATDFVIGAPVPIVTSFSPTSGAIGTNVSVTGQNFSNVDSVTFNGRRSTNIIVNSSTNLQAEVPVGATSGRIRVFTPAGEGISSSDFLITGSTTLRITSFSPTQGPVGTTVLVNGQNMAGVNQAYVNGVFAAIQGVNNTAVTITVPAGATTGPIQLFDNVTGASSASNFIVTGATGVCIANPTTATIAPTTTWTTRLLTSGTGHMMSFAATAGTVYSFSMCNTALDTYLRIYDSNGAVVAENDDNGPMCAGTSASLTWTAAASGTYRVVATNYSCNPLTTDAIFAFRAGATNGIPTITSFSPLSGPIGTRVTVLGTNLNVVQSATVNGTAGNSISQSASQLSFNVSTGSTTGPIGLRYAGGVVQSTTNFTVTGTSNCLAQSTFIGSLTPQVTVQSATVLAGSPSRYLMNLVAGQRVLLSTCGSPGIDSRIAIFNSGGTEVAVYDDNGPSCIGVEASGVFTPGLSGNYSVIVSGPSCTNLTTGLQLQYSLVVSPSISSFTPASGPVGTTVTVNGLGLSGVNQLFLGTVQQNILTQTNTQITFSVAAGSVTDFITVLSLGGQATSATAFVVTTASGCYSSSTSRGTITPTGTWLSVTAAAGAPSRYQFTATAGREYQFSTCGAGTTDTKLRITDVNGNELASFDDNGPLCNGTRASGSFIAPTTGTYQVLLSDYDCNNLTESTGLQYRIRQNPAVTSFTPTSGVVGTQVSIAGTNLDAVTSVEINTLICTILSQAANQIVISIPTGATTAPFVLRHPNGSVTTSTNFTVLTLPTFCTLTPLSRGIVSIGTTPGIVVGNSNTSPYWTFSGVAGTTYTFSTCGATNDTKIRIYNSTTEVANNDDNGPLCTGAAASLEWTPTVTGTYYVLLTNYDCIPLAQSTNLTIYRNATASAPTITSFTPTFGPVGTTVTLSGTNLNTVNRVLVNGTAANVITSQTATSLVFDVPVGATTGLITVESPGGNASSNTVFTVTAAGLFCSASATSQGFIFPVATTNSVTGVTGATPYWNFNATAGTTYVFSTCGAAVDTKLRIYDAAQNLVAENDDNGPFCAGTAASIQFIPATTGQYSILLTSYDCIPLTADAVMSYYRITTSTGPTITSFTPSAGPVGTVITVFGTNLNLVTNGTINGTAAAISAQTSTSLNLTVAAGTSTGRIILVSGVGSATSATDFTVTTQPSGFCIPSALNRGVLTMTTNSQFVSGASLSAPYWSFTGVAGTTYAFNTCGTTVNTKLRIYDANFVLINENDDNGPYCTGTAASLNFRAGATGTYYVLMTNSDCNTLSAAVTLEYQALTSIEIYRLNPVSGYRGDAVNIHGHGFLGATSVTFNGTPSQGYLIANDSLVVAIVPPTANSGTVCVSRGAVFGCSPDPFTILTLPSFCFNTNVLNQGTLSMSSTWRDVNLATGFRHVFKVDAKDGHTYDFSTCNTTNTLNTYIRVYNSLGGLLLENDDNGPHCTGNKASISFPVGTGGIAYIYVSQNSGGTNNCATLTQPAVFSYRETPPAPIITSFTPTSGPVGTRVTVRGRNLSSTIQAGVGSAAGTNLVVTSSDLLAFNVGPGSFTNQIRVTTAGGTANSADVFTVLSSCNNPSISIMPGATNNQLAVTVARASAPLRYELNNVLQSGTGLTNTLNISTAGRYTLRVTDVNNCVVSYSFSYGAATTCNSRISGTTADSVYFFPLSLTAGTEHGVVFDRGTAPRGAALFINGSPAGSIPNAGNTTNLAVSHNASAGMLEVRTTTSNSWSAFSFCRQTSVPLVTLANTAAAPSCNNLLSFANFPRRATVPTGLTTMVLEPANAASVVRLTLLALDLTQSGARIQVYNGGSPSGAPLVVWENQMPTTNTVVTSTAVDGKLTLVINGANGATTLGALIQQTCVANSFARIRLAQPLAATACIGRPYSIGITGQGNVPVPGIATVQLSDQAGSFAAPLPIGNLSVTNAAGVNGSIVIPGILQAGNYRIRVSMGALLSDTFNLVLSPTPVADFTQRNDSLFATPLGGTYQWLYNNSPIPGANDSFLRAGFNGNYSVIVTLGACADTAATRNINQVGKAGMGQSLQVFPNPAHDQLTVEFASATATDLLLRLLNVQGKELGQVVVPAGNTTWRISLTELPAGVYYLQHQGSPVRFVKQ